MTKPTGRPRGRPKGAINRVTAETRAAARAAGITPLEYMLGVLRDPTAPVERRDDMAKSAAPYLHPRLSNAQVTVRKITELTEAELLEFLGDVDRPSTGVPGDGALASARPAGRA